ncbi:MAG: hypothetical protein H6648_10165 [Caldilineae bacterium]|nr:hypothetical protein [Chloroflexota bacterium]MCB9177515.1 hypothetical protein [Caldilineae bacterium]
MSRPRENETLCRHLRLGLGLLILAASATGWRPSASPAGRALAQGQPAPPAIYLPLVLRSQSGFVPARTALPATATPAPSATLEPSPTPSQTPSPSATPEPSPTPTEALPEWQARVNLHRALARLAPVDANADWSRGGELHARYMVKNDLFGHSEQRGNAWFTEEGLAAAQSGNVTISTDIDQPAADAVDYWMVGPFHQVAILDPRLRISGFGEWREAIGTFQYGATLDVLRGREMPARSTRFPVRYPDAGGTMPLLAYPGGESPDPLTSCAGYSVPTGPPLVLMIDGETAPRVTATAFTDDTGRALPHCWFDETSYRNPTRGQQDLGRGVLAMRKAIILIPRSPLTPDSSYGVSITLGGSSERWTFRTAARTAEPPFSPMPGADEALEDELIRLINARRSEAGKPPFVKRPRLTHAARRQASDMAAGDFGSHIGSDGSTPESRLIDAGYRYRLVSADFQTGGGGDAAGLVDLWMGQPTTRDHLLSDKTEIGVGYGFNGASALKHYWYVYYTTPE